MLKGFNSKTLEIYSTILAVFYLYHFSKLNSTVLITINIQITIKIVIYKGINKPWLQKDTRLKIIWLYSLFIPHLLESGGTPNEDTGYEPRGCVD